MSGTTLGGRAVIVVDPQPDFFEGGPLPVAGATRIASLIAAFLTARGHDFSMRIVTQDWHHDPGGHWSEHPDFITSWPVHCVARSEGARIHPTLENESWDVIIRKGQYEGAFSGFEGTSENGSSLASVLESAGVTTVTIVGFATDHCVKATALDARALGFQVNVAIDLCAGVDPETTRDALAEMSDAGVAVVTSSDL